MTEAAIGPDNLTMAIALGGRPEDKAKMVWSRGCIAYFFPSKSAKAMPLLSRTRYCRMLHRSIIESHRGSPAAIMLRIRQPEPEV